MEVIRLRIWIQEFLKDSSALRDRALFHNLAYISGQSDRIFMKVSSQIYQWTRKSPLYSGGNPDSASGWIRTPNPDQILLGGSTRSLAGIVNK